MSTLVLTPADNYQSADEINGGGDAKTHIDGLVESTASNMEAITMSSCDPEISESAKKTSFFDLPAELRLKVYNYFIPDRNAMCLAQDYFSKLRKVDSRLLCICRQIFEEASYEMYGHCVFEVLVDGRELSGRRYRPGGRLRLLDHEMQIYGDLFRDPVELARGLPLRHLRRLRITVWVDNTASSCCNAQDLICLLAEQFIRYGYCLSEVDVEIEVANNNLQDKKWTEESLLQQVWEFCLEPFNALFDETYVYGRTRDCQTKSPRIRYRRHDLSQPDDAGWQTWQPSTQPDSTSTPDCLAKSWSSTKIQLEYMHAYRRHAVLFPSLWNQPRDLRYEAGSATFALECTKLSISRFNNDMLQFRSSHDDLMAIMEAQARNFRRVALANGEDEKIVDEVCEEWLKIEAVLCAILDNREDLTLAMEDPPWRWIASC